MIQSYVLYYIYIVYDRTNFATIKGLLSSINHFFHWHSLPWALSSTDIFCLVGVLVFGVWGLESGVWGLSFGVLCVGSEPWAKGFWKPLYKISLVGPGRPGGKGTESQMFWVLGSGMWWMGPGVWGMGFGVLRVGSKSWGEGFWQSLTRYPWWNLAHQEVMGTEFLVWGLGCGGLLFWSLGFGMWGLGSVWGLGFGVLCVGPRPWAEGLWKPLYQKR